MSSQMGHVGSDLNRTVYVMTKHAIEGLTKAMAVELAPKGVRVVSIAPTFIKTPLTRPFFDDPVIRKWMLDRIPLGRARHGRGGGDGGRFPALRPRPRSSPVRDCSSMAAGQLGEYDQRHCERSEAISHSPGQYGRYCFVALRASRNDEPTIVENG